MKEYISSFIDGKLVLFNALENKERIIFIYGEKVNRAYGYLSFIKRGLDNNQVCLLAHTKAGVGLSLENTFKKQIEDAQLRLLVMDEGMIKERGEDLEHVQSCTKRIYDVVEDICNKYEKNKYSGLRMVIDFGAIAKKKGIEYIKEADTKIFKRALDKVGSSIITISAFDVGSLDADSLSLLIPSYDKVIISTGSESTMSIPISSMIKNDRKSDVTTIVSQEALEHTVKSFLDIIILVIIQKNEVCGLDIINTIKMEYNINLSHGTIYPLLNDLKNKGIIEVKVGKDMRAKVYVPTEEGRKIIDNKVREFTKTHEHILSFIQLGR